jgi:hypothetical protein
MNRMKLWSAVAVCVSLLPLVVAAQDAEAPAAASEHEHAAPPGEASAGQTTPAREHMQGMQQHMQRMGAMRAAEEPASPSRCAEGDTPCGMNELRSENGMMRQRVRLLEERLDALQQQLQQLQDRLSAAPESANRP